MQAKNVVNYTDKPVKMSYTMIMKNVLKTLTNLIILIFNPNYFNKPVKTKKSPLNVLTRYSNDDLSNLFMVTSRDDVRSKCGEILYLRARNKAVNETMWG